MALKKAKVRGQKYFKIMVKSAQNSIRSTELSIAYRFAALRSGGF